MTITAKDSPETNAAGKQGEDSRSSVSNSGESTRSNPVCLEVGVTIRSLPSEAGGVAKPFREDVRTVIVFDNGAVLRCSVNLPIGLTIILTNPSSRDVVCRVVGGRNLPTVKGYIEVQFIEAVSDFWRIHEESLPAAAPPVVPPPVVQPVRAEPAAPRTPAPPRAAAIPEAPAKPASKTQDSELSFEDIGGLTSTPVLTAPRLSKAGSDRPSPELAIQNAGYSHAENSKSTSLANWNLSELDSPATKETSAAISSTLTPAASRDFMSKGLMAYEKPSASSSSAGSRMPMIVGAVVLALAAVGGVAFFMRGSAAPASVAQTSTASQPSTSEQPSSGAAESAGAAQISAPPEASGTQPSAQSVAMEQGQPTAAITPTPAVVIGSASDDSRADQQKVRLSEKNAVVARKAETSAVRRPAMPNLKIKSPSAPKRNNSDSNGGVAPSAEIAMSEPVAVVPSAGLLTSGGRTSGAPLPPAAFVAPAPLAPAPVAAAKTVREPKLISSSKVSYPASAKQANIQGTVTLSLTIDERGNVIGAKVLNGPLLLRQSAADSVKLWKYSPGLLDGKPAPSQVTVGVDFKLN